MTPRRQIVALAAILVLAAALRVTHVLALRGDVLFDAPVIDEARYVEDARALASNKPTTHAREAYWQPPGISFATAAVFRVAGPGLLAPRVVQALVSAATCLLVFLLARRFFPAGVAIAAAAVTAGHGVLIHAAGELLAPTWAGFLDALALWLLARDPPRPWAAMAAGLALGTSAVFVPTILVFVPIALVWLWRRAPPQRAALIAAVCLGIAAPLFPVALRNYQAGHELVLVSTNSGVNLYLGNNARYRETLSLRPGRRWEALMAEPAAAGARTPVAASRFFTARAARFVGEHPLQALALYGRKLFLYVHGAEIPRDTDIYAARDQSTVVRGLVWPAPIHAPDGLLLPLALLGIAVTIRGERKRTLLLWGFVATQAVVAAAFFVTSRYRVPALPVLAIFAVVGVAHLARLVRERRGRAAIAAGASVVVLAILLNVPTWETRTSFRGELDFYRGLAYADAKPALAAQDFRRAVAAAPRDPRPWYELGNVLERLRQPRDAADAWRRAGELDPWDLRPGRRAAATYGALGDYETAELVLRANIDAGAREPAMYAFEHLNIGWLRAHRGDYGAALEAVREAARRDPRWWRDQMASAVAGMLRSGQYPDAPFWSALGDLLAEQRAPELARQAWQRAAELAPAATEPPGSP